MRAGPRLYAVPQRLGCSLLPFLAKSGSSLTAHLSLKADRNGAVLHRRWQLVNADSGDGFRPERREVLRLPVAILPDADAGTTPALKSRVEDSAQGFAVFFLCRESAVGFVQKQ